MHAHLFGINLSNVHAKIPAGFRRRRKNEKKCPYPPNAIIELLIKTPNGIMSMGPTRPRLLPGVDRTLPPEEAAHDAWARLPAAVVADRVLALNGEAPVPNIVQTPPPPLPTVLPESGRMLEESRARAAAEQDASTGAP